MANSVQGETVVASFVLAVAAVVGAFFVGQVPIGAGVAAGLLLGSWNGFIIKAALDRGAPILVTSFLRLTLLSLLALAAARILGASIWPVVAGVGVAQLVMVGVGVRQGLRA